jgi:hypothetical protein
MRASRLAIATLLPNSAATHSVSFIEKCVYSECLVTQLCRDLFQGPLVNVPCRRLPWQRMCGRVTLTVHRQHVIGVYAL